MDAVNQDIRYAIRLCLRTPGFTVVAVLALALGIGANTAIFTIVDAVLLERLPFRDPAGIVVLWEEGAHRPGRSNVLGPSQFLRWGDRATTFSAMAALVDTRANLTSGGDPEEVVLQNVTAQFFPILGVSPLIGRTIQLNARPQTVVGVMPQGFRRFIKQGARAGKLSDMWSPDALPADAR